MFKLGAMTEEAGADIQTSVQTVKNLGLEFIEVSSFGSQKVSDMTDDEIGRLKAALDDAGISVSCVSPTIFFNVPLHADPDEGSFWGSYNEHIEALRRSINAAHLLRTDIVRVFGFKTETLLDPPLTGDHWPLLVEKLRQPVEIAEKEGVTLAIETCFFNNIGTCTMARRLMDDLGSPNFKVLWDIVNCLFQGETVFPDGYELIKDDIAHIHLKDGHPNAANMTFPMCPLGEGEVQRYPEIFAALGESGYSGGMSLECEFTPPGGTLADALGESLAAFKKLTAGN